MYMYVLRGFVLEAIFCFGGFFCGGGGVINKKCLKIDIRLKFHMSGAQYLDCVCRILTILGTNGKYKILK